jgi:hypothetical protein
MAKLRGRVTFVFAKTIPETPQYYVVRTSTTRPTGGSWPGSSRSAA